MRPPHNITKLPKWAQNEIQRLTRDLEDARSQLRAGPEDSDTFADPYSSAPRPLGKGPTIDFVFGEHWGEQFQARLEGKVLRVNGGNSIAVLPRASNLVEIEIVR